MDSYIIDWRSPDKYIMTETMRLVGKDTVDGIAAKRFNINSLNVRTKDGFYLEIDARMIIQLDDNSFIIARFGSIPRFAEYVVNPLVNDFLRHKERAIDLCSNRLKLQEDLADELQIELARYHIKIRSFIMVYSNVVSNTLIENLKKKTLLIYDEWPRK